MAFIDAVAVLADQWHRVPELLSDPARHRLQTLVDDAGHVVSDRDRSRVWHEVVGLLQDELPVSSAVRRQLLAALDVPRLSHGPAEGKLPVLPRLAARKPAVEDWIRAARAVSPANVRRRGVDPEQPGLIRLRRPDGRVSLPTFQFTRTGEPNPLVLRINELLGADTDPWGVADWWLCRNVWLSGAPAHLIDEVDDQLLVAAAVAVMAG